MKLLKAETAPPTRPFTRRHSPSDRLYKEFRPCLRWEFGFTCAFCLLHETDFFEFGTEHLGVFTIEHLETQVNAPALKDKYKNCYYACRFCNIIGRKRQPREASDGRRLLDPSETPWAAHFSLKEDELIPIAEDKDAQYTETIYMLNFPIKVKLRKKRRELMKRLEKKSLVDKLRQIADQLVSEIAKRDLLNIADELEKKLEQIRLDVLRYVAIPTDADKVCKCDQTSNLTLPPEIDRQTQEIL